MCLCFFLCFVNVGTHELDVHCYFKLLSQPCMDNTALLQNTFLLPVCWCLNRIDYRLPRDLANLRFAGAYFYKASVLCNLHSMTCVLCSLYGKIPNQATDDPLTNERSPSWQSCVFFHKNIPIVGLKLRA